MGLLDRVPRCYKKAANGLLRCLLPAHRTPFWTLPSVFRQYQKSNSQKIAPGGGQWHHACGGKASPAALSIFRRQEGGHERMCPQKRTRPSPAEKQRNPTTTRTTWMSPTKSMLPTSSATNPRCPKTCALEAARRFAATMRSAFADLTCTTEDRWPKGIRRSPTL
jgi:hypothetical protein